MPDHAPRSPLAGSAFGAAATMVLALLLVTASTSFLMRPPPGQQEVAAGEVPMVAPTDPPEDARGLHLYLVPHPDDEISAWTSLLESDDLYPVMVLLTQGEATQRCAADPMTKHLSPELGEISPHPDPSTDEATSGTCREARLNSFRQALAAAAVHTPVVDLDWTSAQDLEVAGGPATVVHGPAAMLIVLDLGDNTLTAEAVEDALRSLLGNSANGLPDLSIVRVTSSAYYAGPQSNEVSDCDNLPVCPDGPAYVYDHPDHLAVREATRSLAPLAQEGGWLVTHPADPAASRHLALSGEVYDQFMALGEGDPPTAQRLGSHQRVYGWLAFPDAWRPGDLPLRDAQVVFPRIQSYEVVAP